MTHAISPVVLVLAVVDRAGSEEGDTEDPRRALREAVERRDDAEALRLLAAGVDPARAVVWLSRAGDEEALAWLFANGAVIDGMGPDGIAATTLSLARRAGRLQSGYVYHYAFAMLIGVVILISWYLIVGRG